VGQLLHLHHVSMLQLLTLLQRVQLLLSRLVQKLHLVLLLSAEVKDCTAV
jgi:hypothetical protein